MEHELGTEDNTGESMSSIMAKGITIGEKKKAPGYLIAEFD